MAARRFSIAEIPLPDTGKTELIGRGSRATLDNIGQFPTVQRVLCDASPSFSDLAPQPLSAMRLSNVSIVNDISTSSGKTETFSSGRLVWSHF